MAENRGHRIRGVDRPFGSESNLVPRGIIATCVSGADGGRQLPPGASNTSSKDRLRGRKGIGGHRRLGDHDDQILQKKSVSIAAQGGERAGSRRLCTSVQRLCDEFPGSGIFRHCR